MDNTELETYFFGKVLTVLAFVTFIVLGSLMVGSVLRGILVGLLLGFAAARPAVEGGPWLWQRRVKKVGMRGACRICGFIESEHHLSMLDPPPCPEYMPPRDSY